MQWRINLRSVLPFVAAVVVASFCSSARATNDVEWELASLCYEADTVVEVQVLQGRDLGMNVQVKRSYYGSLVPGMVVNIPTPFGQHELFLTGNHAEAGDRSFLFLKRGELLPDGGAHDVRGKVYRYASRDWPAVMLTDTPLDAAGYRGMLAREIVETAKLRKRMNTAPAAEDIPWLLSLIRERLEYQNHFNPILEAAQDRLRAIGDVSALEHADAAKDNADRHPQVLPQHFVAGSVPMGGGGLMIAASHERLAVRIATALIAIFGLFMLRAAMRSRRRLARYRRGLCLQCCYDLRATAGRCPECGNPNPPELRVGMLRRRLLRGTWVILLVSCVLFGGLWIRSYWAGDCLIRTLEAADCVYSARGVIGVQRDTFPGADGWSYERANPRELYRSARELGDLTWWYGPGFEYVPREGWTGIADWLIFAGLVLFALLSKYAAQRQGRIVPRPLTNL
jgi:hypothetical protein